MEEDKLIFGILSYLWILAFIPYYSKKDDEIIRSHAKQGIMLFFLWVIIFLTQIIGIILEKYISFVRIHLIGLLDAIALVFYIAIMVLSIIGITYAVEGRRNKFPILGKYAEKINF